MLRKLKDLPHGIEYTQSVLNYNKAVNKQMKKSVRTMLNITNLEINLIDHQQNKLFQSYKTLGDLKQKIALTEYKDQVEVMKEKLKNDKKFQSDKAVTQSDLYRNTKNYIKADLVQRFKFTEKSFVSDSYESFKTAQSRSRSIDHNSSNFMSSSKRSLSVRPGIDVSPRIRTNSFILDKDTDAKTSLSLRAEVDKASSLRDDSFNNKNFISGFDSKRSSKHDINYPTAVNRDEANNFYNTLKNHRLSVLVSNRRNYKTYVKAYRIDKNGSVVETEPPERKNFNIYFDAMRKSQIKAALKNEQNISCECYKKAKQFQLIEVKS